MIKLIKFSIKNLLNKKLSFLLLTIFLIIWFWFLFFISIIKTYSTFLVKDYFWTHSVKNKIIVEKSEKSISNLLDILWTNKTREISDKDIKNISKIDWVNHVYKASFFKNSSLMKISFLWKYLETDVFFIWLDSSMIDELIPWFNKNNDYIPLLVSDKAYSSLLEVFFKKSWNKSIGKNLLKNTTFDIIFWKSVMLSNQGDGIEKVWKIVWFSDDVSLVFIGIPLDVLQDINKKLTWKELWIDKLYVSYKAWFDQEVIQSQINSLWFQTSFSDDTSNSIESMLNLFFIIITFIIYLFLLIITYSIISFILLTLEESKRDNAIMYSLWIDKKLITLVYFLEWFFISISWLLFSILIVYYIISKINDYFVYYNSNHFIINLQEIHISVFDFIPLSLWFIWLNFLFFIFSSYKIYSTRYENML